MAAARPLGRVLWMLALTALVLALAVLLGGLVYRLIEPPLSPERAENPARLMGEIVQIQVLNGAGEPGAARQVTEFLRSQGFDVVEHGNRHPFDVDETHVIDRVGSRSSALRVARALGLGEQSVIEEVDPRFYVDATVIIGRDFNRLPAFSP